MIRRPTRLKIEITERDSRIMSALWRWKLLSTSALTRRYFPNGNRHTAYERLHKLAKFNYLKAIYIDKRKQQCWALGAAGFKFKRESIGEHIAKSFRSEHPYHDHIATALHLGEWLVDPPLDTQTYTEQELRSVPIELWDRWVPSSTLHRPDGYSIFLKADEPIIVSFEAELSLKAKQDYGKIVVFYDTQEKINIVVWLVRNSGNIKSLKKHFNELDIVYLAKHQFLLLKDFETSGWNAKFIDGSLSGRSLTDIMPVGHVRPPLATYRDLTLLLLDLSKRPKLAGI